MVGHLICHSNFTSNKEGKIGRLRPRNSCILTISRKKCQLFSLLFKGVKETAFDRESWINLHQQECSSQVNDDEANTRNR